jgi:outer membrane protein TolC
LRLRVRWTGLLVPAALAVGCATGSPTVGDGPVDQITPQPPLQKPTDATAGPPKVEPPPPAAISSHPAYGAGTTLPIDLPTVFRLVNAQSPVVGFARARVREAIARQDQAELLWLPTLRAGSEYNRLDGNTQDTAGLILRTSKGNLFGGGAAALTVDSAEAIYQPLVTRQLTRAASFNERAATFNAQLDAALAYQDLIQAHALLAVNADTLARAEQMLKFAKDAQAAQLSKTAGDVNRAQTEVYLRQQERTDLEGRAGAAAARLGQLLLLDPTVVLVPADLIAAPVELIDPARTLDDLITIAVVNHPDLAAHRAQAAAAWEQVRKARNRPFLPRVAVQDAVGTFGGGLNDTLTKFDARNTLSVQLYWELQNLGLGVGPAIRVERAVYDQALYQVADAQARVTAAAAEAARVAAAKAAGLDLARKAVAEAGELYRKLQETSFNMVGPRAQYDALEPLLAVQALNQARTQYVTAVVEYNRAQLRLYAALGHPPECTAPAPTTPAR